MSHGRVLAIDYGDVRVGVAISDELGWTAQGLDVIDTRKEELLGKILEYVKKFDIRTIVLGLPKNMNGSIGPRGEIVIKFKEELEVSTDVPVVMFDERLTTKLAAQTLSRAGLKARKQKNVIDKIAAQIILQGYLESESQQNPPVIDDEE